jgi:peroxiredoxin
MDRFTELGASLGAISPQTPSNSLEMVKRNDLTFHILSDHKNVVGKEFGVVVTIPENLAEAYRRSGHDLIAANDDDSYELPLPASFVIDGKRIIRMSFIDPDHTKRVDPDQIVDALRDIQNG